MTFSFVEFQGLVDCIQEPSVQILRRPISDTCFVLTCCIYTDLYTDRFIQVSLCQNRRCIKKLPDSLDFCADRAVVPLVVSLPERSKAHLPPHGHLKNAKTQPIYTSNWTAQTCIGFDKDMLAIKLYNPPHRKYVERAPVVSSSSRTCRRESKSLSRSSSTFASLPSSE